jgi:choice-of-anchor C domain-containing protein
MKTRSILGGAAASVASIMLAGTAMAAFLGATNGSFEDGTYPGGALTTLAAGSASLSGWVITSGSVDWTGTYWPAKSGSKSLDLSGAGPGAISQTLVTTVGKTYVVSFAMSGNPDGGPALKTLTVGATGAATTPFSFDTGVAGNTLSDMKWATKTYTFVATSTTTVLAFTSATAGAWGPALDAVVVTESATSGSGGTGGSSGSSAAGGPGAKCKNGGWRTMVDNGGHHFRNQGDCVSYFASKGKNAGSGPK